VRSDKETQISFFSWLKTKTTADELVNSLEELLCISKDSVYRRMRGETLLTFNEISKISQHFNISLDSYLNLTSQAVVFQSRFIDHEFTFKSYIQSIAENLKMIRNFESNQLTYLAKDVPIFHYFQFRKLANFKIFFWLKTVVGVPELQHLNYSPDAIDKSTLDLCYTTWKQFEQIPSTEIWNNETINITISQINYYLESEILKVEDAQEIVDEYLALVRHIRLQATYGKKYAYGLGDVSTLKSGDFYLYLNEVEIGDNTILFKMNEQRMVFKAFNTLNTISTSDENFCEQTEHHINRLIAKSTPLSLSSEKERTRFCNRMEEKVAQLKQKISLTQL